jgi:hypothetical protein
VKYQNVFNLGVGRRSSSRTNSRILRARNGLIWNAEATELRNSWMQYLPKGMRLSRSPCITYVNQTT